MSALTARPATLALAAASALATAVFAGRPWVQGVVDDAVIGGTLQQATGQESVTGVVALGLVFLAGAVAAAATKALGRRVSALVVTMAALSMAILVLRVLLDPDAVLGAIAAAGTGRTGTLRAEAQATFWVYLALLPALGGLVVGALAWRGARHWPQPSPAYDRPDQERPGQESPGEERQGTRGERVSSEWDQLSSGEDPTVGRGTP